LWWLERCNGNRVTAIDLSQNGLSGTLPESLGNLSNLELLFLQDNKLIGSIPESLGNLTNLTTLYLQLNELSGSIPSSLGSLTNLVNLHLYENELSGSIPESLSTLTNLTKLHLYRNQLSGSIPASLSALTKLKSLDLSRNQLSGSIPESLGQLTNLNELDLSDNQLSGSIPSSLGNLTNLVELSLYDNQLSGSIPSSLGNLSNLGLLFLERNELSGSIPESLGNLTKLVIIFLNLNQLSGCFPGSLSALCGTSSRNFRDNPGLPGGGDFESFCRSGAGSQNPVVTASVSSLCAGTPVSLSVSIGSWFSWSGPNNFASTVQHPTLINTSPASSRVYSVTVGNSDATCTATSSTTLTVLAIPNPPTLIPSPTQPILQNTPAVTLAITGCEGGSIQWKGTNGSSSSSTTINLPTSTVTTLVYSATCTIGSCLSEPGSTTVTVAPALITGSFDGFVYGADCATFRGWAWDRTKANTPISVEILDGPTVIGTLMAEVFRQDLQTAGKGNGKHAFLWSIPEGLKDGKPHTLSARVSGSSFILKDLPKALVCEGVPVPGGNQPPQPPAPRC
jgi:hypothetical protein